MIITVETANGPYYHLIDLKEVLEITYKDREEEEAFANFGATYEDSPEEL